MRQCQVFNTYGYLNGRTNWQHFHKDLSLHCIYTRCFNSYAVKLLKHSLAVFILYSKKSYLNIVALALFSTDNIFLSIQVNPSGELFLTFASTLVRLQTVGCSAVQSQKAVSAYSTSKQILHFGFAEQYSPFVLLPLQMVASLLYVTQGGNNEQWLLKWSSADLLSTCGLMTIQCHAPLQYGERDKCTSCCSWQKKNLRILSVDLSQQSLKKLKWDGNNWYLFYYSLF